jgi:ketol-acid reductoisomerase
MPSSAKIFYEKDASLDPLSSKTIVFVGYGNQGRAQALNLRDTIRGHAISHPPAILIANPSDSFSHRAETDGFESTTDWAHAASIADILFLLVPDQIQPKLFNEKIKPTLKKSCAIVVASGYNVFYKYLEVGATEDIVMVAPRMIGAGVRSRYESGEGFPCFVSVEQVC